MAAGSILNPSRESKIPVNRLMRTLGWLHPYRLCLLLSSIILAPSLQGQNVDIPLTVEESAGVARAAEPITTGVPFLRGVMRDTSRLRLYGPDGKLVPAAFRAVNTWWDDSATQAPSAQWVHVDFFADVAAHGRAVYHLRISDELPPPPPAALKVETDAENIKVDTGAVAFTVHKTGPFLDAPGFRSADILLRTDERMYKASQWPASQLVVEEQSPLRVVLKRTGSHGWANKQEKSLDYVIRIIAYAGRPHIKLVYSFVNRQGREMSDFVRLDGLWLQAKLERAAPPVRVEQLGAEPHRTGWFDAGGVGIGLRWFWQLYPKAFEVRPDGVVRLAIFPETARPQDIYTGVAKTHEIILSFKGDNLAAQLDNPLYAVAPPKWYTRDTHALGRLVESSPKRSGRNTGLSSSVTTAGWWHPATRSSPSATAASCSETAAWTSTAC